MAKLQCGMVADCGRPVTHIDEKGFVYCAMHGAQRRNYCRVRALKAFEARRLERGETISYTPKRARDYTTQRNAAAACSLYGCNA